MSNELKYNSIEMDPLEDLFDKIHKARGGEMMLVHISEHGKDGPSVRLCSVINKDKSILTEVLPSLVNKFIDGQ